MEYTLADLAAMGPSERLKKSGDDVVEAARFWSSADVLRSSEIQARRNQLALGRINSGLLKGEVQGLAEGLATPVDGVEKHVGGDNGRGRVLGHEGSPVETATVAGALTMKNLQITDGQLYELNDAAFEVIKRMLRDGQDETEIKLCALRNLWGAYKAIRLAILGGGQGAPMDEFDAEVRAAIAKPKRMRRA